MNPEEMKERTKSYALQIIRFIETLPRNQTTNVISRQLLKPGLLLVPIIVRLAARSNADFIWKMGIVEEEADKSLYWMELMVDAKIVTMGRVSDLMSEGDEILAIVVASIRTARRRPK